MDGLDAMAKTKAKEATKASPLLAEAKERFAAALDAWSDNRKWWIEDAKFRNLEQWPDDIKRLRSVPGKERPMLVVDKLNQYINQVVNDSRQNRPAVKVLPVDDSGDQDVAEALQGIIRNICNRSRADEAFDTSIEHAAGNGFGFFRVLTEYAHKGTFNQDIVIKRIRNPLAVLLDPNIQAADGSDSCYAFVIDDVPKDKFKSQYPKAKFTNWQSDASAYGDWMAEKTVRVCEYWYKIEVPQTLHYLTNGDTVEDADYQKRIAKGEPLEIQLDEVTGEPMTRQVTAYQVKWARLTGAEVLEENDWLGEDIPIIPVFGHEQDIEGKVIYSGLIRKAKDAQRLYNFSRSAFAERVAMTPRAPWIAADEAIADYDEWGNPNTGNVEVLRYKSVGDDGQQLPPPQRVNPSDVPAGFLKDMEAAEHDIQGSIGMYNASLGERSNEKSGKAIMARQREGDTATFHFQDNLNRAISYLGRVLVDLIPKVYDSKRAIRILGEDGKATSAMVDPRQTSPMQEIKQSKGVQAIYNLGIGRYDVVVAAGPSYTTKRQEGAEMMTQILQGQPELMRVAGDIFFRILDMPYAEELSERMKKMLPPELQDKDEENPELTAAIKQLQQLEQEAQAAVAERDEEIASLQQQLKGKDGEVAVKAHEAGTKRYEAETERLATMAPAITPELIQQIAAQTAESVLGALMKSIPPPDPEPMPAMPDPNQPPEGGFLLPEGM
jgi:hypothetical protein